MAQGNGQNGAKMDNVGMVSSLPQGSRLELGQLSGLAHRQMRSWMATIG